MRSHKLIRAGSEHGDTLLYTQGKGMSEWKSNSKYSDPNGACDMTHSSSLAGTPCRSGAVTSVLNSCDLLPIHIFQAVLLKGYMVGRGLLNELE